MDEITWEVWLQEEDFREASLFVVSMYKGLYPVKKVLGMFCVVPKVNSRTRVGS